jgi:hypothetical protein
MPTPPGFASCSYELRHSLMSRSAFLTFGVDPTATDPNGIATSLASAFAAPGSLFTTLDSNVQLQQTRVSLGTDGTEDIVGTSPQLVACTLGGTSPPANCAVLVHKRTARGGRRGRGRMYIPWACSVSSIGESGVVLAADITRIGTAVAAWAAQVTSLVGPLVILHRPSTPGTIHPSVPGTPNPVTSFVVDPLVGTQRRRLGR